MTSKVKYNKMLNFIPDITNKGNGQKVKDAWDSLQKCESAQEVLNWMSMFGGVIGYGTCAYLMEFQLLNETPPASYFGAQIQETQPVEPAADYSWIEKLLATA